MGKISSQWLTGPLVSNSQPHPNQATVQYPGVNGLNEGSNIGAITPIEAVGDHCCRELLSILQAVPSAYANTQLQSSPPVTRSSRALVPYFAQQFLSSAFDALLQQGYGEPEMLAGVKDWALQGIDMVFFDSLMSGANSRNRDAE
jgi:hypothetical protein